MRVLQINTRYKYGGSTGRIAYDIKNISESNDIEAYCAYGFEFVAMDEPGTMRIESALELTVSKVRSRIFGVHGFYSEFATRKLLGWIDELQPDVIHLHNIHNHYVNCRMLFDYIKARNIPVVWTLHDCWSFTGHCAYFDYSGCDRWKTECHSCPCKGDYPYAWFSAGAKKAWNKKKDVFCGVDNLVLCPPSRWLGELVRESFLKEYPVRVINNGVDVELFKPMTDLDEVRIRYGLAGKTVYLAMMNILEKRKGISCLKAIPERLADDEILVIVGLSDKDRAYFPREKCMIINRTDSIAELVSLYNIASCFINTTLEDNFPTTNIEALSCGTPVVTFKTGGSSECVEDCEELKAEGSVTWSSVGAVVPQGDVDSMLKAARTFRDGGKSHYIEPCRHKAMERYNKNTQYLKYIDLYKQLAADGKR